MQIKLHKKIEGVLSKETQDEALGLACPCPESCTNKPTKTKMQDPRVYATKKHEKKHSAGPGRTLLTPAKARSWTSKWQHHLQENLQQANKKKYHPTSSSSNSKSEALTKPVPLRATLGHVKRCRFFHVCSYANQLYPATVTSLTTVPSFWVLRCVLQPCHELKTKHLTHDCRAADKHLAFVGTLKVTPLSSWAFCGREPCLRQKNNTKWSSRPHFSLQGSGYRWKFAACMRWASCSYFRLNKNNN